MVLTVAEVAEELGVSSGWVHKLIRRGLLPAKHLGGGGKRPGFVTVNRGDLDKVRKRPKVGRPSGPTGKARPSTVTLTADLVSRSGLTMTEINNMRRRRSRGESLRALKEAFGVSHEWVRQLTLAKKPRQKATGHRKK